MSFLTLKFTELSFSGQFNFHYDLKITHFGFSDFLLMAEHHCDMIGTTVINVLMISLQTNSDTDLLNRC